MEKKKAIIIGEILKTKAIEIWNVLPQYNNIEKPYWSNRWLDRFKKRYKIKEYIQHREAGSIATDDPSNIVQMEVLQQLYKEYKLQNILNIDKTSLN